MMGQIGLQVFQPPHLHTTVLHVDQMLRKIHHSKGLLELWKATKTDQEYRGRGYRGTEATKEEWAQRNTGQTGTQSTEDCTQRISGYRGTESTKEWMLQTNTGHRGTLDTKEETESTEKYTQRNTGHRRQRQRVDMEE